jgi:hypothetical protein
MKLDQRDKAVVAAFIFHVANLGGPFILVVYLIQNWPTVTVGQIWFAVAVSFLTILVAAIIAILAPFDGEPPERVSRERVDDARTDAW